MIQFPNLKEQVECAVDNGKLRKCIEEMKLLQDVFKSRFCEFAKEYFIFAFINPFSLCEQKIMKMPGNIQIEAIDLKTNPILKTKFELVSVPCVPEIPVPGDPYPVTVFQD